jgi:uncharacterized membrane protein YhaH (DUF805 family)
VEFLRILFSPFGRIGRLAYWMASIFSFVALYAVVGLTSLLPQPNTQAAAFDAHAGEYVFLMILCLLVLILNFWWSIAISVKRWHDRGKSGLWYLINFIPLIGAIWQFVECGLLPGEPGVNRYGPPQGLQAPGQTAEVFS